MPALFTDVQDFSAIAEQMEPVRLISLLNLYLSEMSNIIKENLGTIDKYVGDAIIAFFGAPLRRENHAALACRSALQMKDAEKALNKRVAEENLSPLPFFTRIGINTGPMVVGNMGSKNKLNYTVMGNAVNLASRLEGANKQYHTGGVLISEYTKNAIGDEFVCRTLGRARLVGINSPLRLYEVIGFAEKLSPEEIERIAVWEKAVKLFDERQFREAGELFGHAAEGRADDGAAMHYLDRCREFAAAPPPDGWDGVNNLTQK
jgi:adenylate cyclase